MTIVDPNAASSPVWAFFNSPLVIALITALVSVGFGGFLANWLSHKWQLRAMRYEVQLQALHRFMSRSVECMGSLGRGDAQNRIDAIKSSFHLSEALAVFETEGVRNRVMEFLESMPTGSGRDVTKEQTDKMAKSFVLAVSAMLEELGIKSLEATARR